MERKDFRSKAPWENEGNEITVDKVNACGNAFSQAGGDTPGGKNSRRNIAEATFRTRTSNAEGDAKGR